MNKLVEFPTIHQWVEKSVSLVNEGTPMLIAYKKADGDVFTGWWKASPQERQELISHLQIDVILGVVESCVEELK